MKVAAITNTATTFVTGRWRGFASWLKIQIGSVSCWPAVNVVTITSSNESANASIPPASSAVAMFGKLRVWDTEHNNGVLLYLEDLGFCKKGEAGAFVAEGRLGPSGSLPSMQGGWSSATWIVLGAVACIISSSATVSATR